LSWGWPRLEINGKQAWHAAGIRNKDRQGYIACKPKCRSAAVRVPQHRRHRTRPQGDLRWPTLAGWERPPTSRLTAEGRGWTILCTGQKGNLARSHKEFGDFNVRMEDKVAGGNSGVYIRCLRTATTWPGVGHRDPRSRRLGEHLQEPKLPVHRQLICHPPASPRVGKARDMERSRSTGGQHYQVIHNDKISMPRRRRTELQRAPRVGYLGLQNTTSRWHSAICRLGPAYGSPKARVVAGEPAVRPKKAGGGKKKGSTPQRFRRQGRAARRLSRSNDRLSRERAAAAATLDGVRIV